MRNEVLVSGEVARVKLTKGFEAVIDAADVELVAAYRWAALVNKTQVYAFARGDGGKTIYMHRLIAGTPAHLMTDHIDCDGLNNRRANLRHATKAQNEQNKARHKNNKSGRKGVWFDKATGKWRAQIMVHKKARHLGRFLTLDEAHAAYASAAAALHGAFARAA